MSRRTDRLREAISAALPCVCNESPNRYIACPSDHYPRVYGAMSELLDAEILRERVACRDQAVAAVTTGLRCARIDGPLAEGLIGVLHAAFDALGVPLPDEPPSPPAGKRRA